MSEVYDNNVEIIGKVMNHLDSVIEKAEAEFAKLKETDYNGEIDTDEKLGIYSRYQKLQGERDAYEQVLFIIAEADKGKNFMLHQKSPITGVSTQVRF